MLQHIDPAELEIVGLENVKSAEEAQSIELIGKQSMKKLKLEWTEDAERSVDDKLLLEKLVPPSTVQGFQIRGYNSVSFPAWLMDIMHYLPKLTSVTMWGMPNCKVLPPMDQLPNLNRLVLRDMASLEEWNTSYSSGQECVIDSVELCDCPKLRIKLLPPRARQLTVLNCDSVLSSWGEYTGGSVNRLDVDQHLSSLSSLCLYSLQEIPKWVGELTSLHSLQILHFSELTELHGNMRQLTELHSLELGYCNSIASLPYWLGELTSLKELRLYDCGLIRSLPEGIQQLTNLQYLYISNCPALQKWCETDEEIMKPTPNQKRACVLPTSLQKLKIDNCNGIRSLPEGIQQLTNLQQLEIVNCDGISSLPEGIQQLTNLQELRIGRCPALKKWCDLEENATKLAHIKDKVCVHTPCHVNLIL
jgi:hypothetical protein